MITGLQFIL